MTLFLITCMPLSALLIAVLAVSGALRTERAASPGALLWQFAAGIIAALPCLVLILLIRPLLEGSYRPGRLYFSLLLGRHALPALLALACYIGIQKAPFSGRNGYGLTSFSDTAIFLAGCFGIFCIADFIGRRGELTGYSLFLAPVVQVAAVVVYARALPEAVRGSRWEERGVPVGAMAAWPFLASFGDFWSALGRGVPAALAAIGVILLVGAGIIVTTPGSRPRLLRGNR